MTTKGTYGIRKLAKGVAGKTAPKDTQKCAVCGVEREGPTYGGKTDHIRTVYVRNGALEHGYFRPALNEEEMRTLKGNGGGEQKICSHRRRCRRRQSKRK